MFLRRRLGGAGRARPRGLGTRAEDPTPFPRAQRVDSGMAQPAVKGRRLARGELRTQRGKPLSGASGPWEEQSVALVAFCKKLKGRASSCGGFNKGAKGRVAGRPIAVRGKRPR